MLLQYAGSAGIKKRL